MTNTSQDLVQRLVDAIEQKKALLLTGSSGVGKTFIAKEVANSLQKDEKYKLFLSEDFGITESEIVSCHSGISYEDIVGGLDINTVAGDISFDYKDKILIQCIKKASSDYYKGNNNKYVFIMDDIQRNDISIVLGEVISAIGLGTEVSQISLNNGTVLDVTPNFYFIATSNPTEFGANQIDRGLYSIFYTYEILSNINYMTEDTSAEERTAYDKVRSIIFNNLDIQYRTSTYEQNRYLVGHGYFKNGKIQYTLRYQLLPLLRQYVKEGILDKMAETAIDSLEESCIANISALSMSSAKKQLDDYRNGVSSRTFIDEDSTSVPIENIVGRIIEQGLISEAEIIQGILLNGNVCYREKEVGGITYTAALVAEPQAYMNIARSGGDKRKFYNAGEIKINGVVYHFTGGMQPREYTNGIKGIKDPIWNITGNVTLGESTKPNIVLFGIVKNYYAMLLEDIENLVIQKGIPADKSFYQYVKDEWDTFLTDYKGIKPVVAALPTGATSKQKKAADADANFQANKDVRELIGGLSILWKDIGDTVVLQDGTDYKIKRLERTMAKNGYEEYKDIMDTLGVRQMVLQGPPGTSKTYSAKAFLRFQSGCKDNKELDELQIIDYDNKDFCKKLQNNESTSVAWDIVQFHPSYGYEDFIRGIKVSTSEDTEQINYQTVNKVLGNIAALAISNPDITFYLVIDEINRANLATVFGELIYGLEYRKEQVSTPYTVDDSNKICLPENLYIIGTMNTADKSIGGIDYAIRRRFLFFEQLPERGVIEEYGDITNPSQKDINGKASKLFDNVEKVFENLSSEYRKEDVQIGHTYFLVESEDQLEKRFIYQILPILKEYYKDGMLSFVTDGEEEGYEGFLSCIEGKLNITQDEKTIKKIFQSLIQ